MRLCNAPVERTPAGSVSAHDRIQLGVGQRFVGHRFLGRAVFIRHQNLWN
jgi:hypothetical protein